MALTEKLTAIAEAIRSKTGGEEALTLSQMAAEIADIQPEQPVLQALSVTLNGLYRPPDGVDGYSEVKVSVATGGYSDDLAERLTNTLIEYSNSEITELYSYAFYNCTELRKLYLPYVHYIGDCACQILGGSKLQDYDFKSVVTIGRNGCYGLTLGDITEKNFPNLYEIYVGGLRNVGATKIEKPNSTLKIHGTAFEGNSQLTKVDIWAAEWGYSNQLLLFWSCPLFDTFIIRRTDKVNPWCGWAGAFNSTRIAAGNGYIYVPSALVEAYKAATGWADWAEQIRAIENYPEITGG